MKHRAVVAGGSGYIGSEILRILIGHPQVEIAEVCGNTSAGRSIVEEHPGFRGLLDLTITKLEAVNWDGIDVCFLALPSGEAMEAVRRVPDRIRIIDATPDFRLRARAVYEKFYKRTHSNWDMQKEFVYGLPELFREEIREARCIAAPGCFATASILATHPFVQAGLSQGPFYISAVTGSSGSGANPKEITHHPFRAESLFAYGTFTHRHIPEIEQAIGAPVILQPHSGPFVRGILATVFAKIDGDPAPAFEKAYANEPFIRLVEKSPNVKWVEGTNFADIAVHTNGEHGIAIVASDNLTKGGGGQAVQCMNLQLGLEEDAGLRLAGANP